MPTLVHGVLAGYESDDSWDVVLNANYEEEENNVALLTYRYSDRPQPGYPRFHQRGQVTNCEYLRRARNEPVQRLWDNQPYGQHTRSQETLLA